MVTQELLERLEHYGKPTGKTESLVGPVKNTVGTDSTNTKLVDAVIATSSGMLDDTDKPYLNALSAEELNRWRNRLAGTRTASPSEAR
jgi:hypothetical protein